MLGIFDSGFGGLTIAKSIHARLPELSTIYLGDNVRMPYGARSQEEIFQFTLEGVRFLFAQGCPLIILACNTASSGALRKIQQEVLPREFPDRRVLGVIRPAAEYLAKYSARVGILATPATVESGAYAHELYKLNPAIKVSQQACAGLAEAIENRANEEGLNLLVKNFVAQLLSQDKNMQEILLGCTHYPLIADVFRKNIPENIHLISQQEIVAESLVNYLSRHRNLNLQLEKKAERKYFTTSENPNQDLASLFYGTRIEFVTR